MPDARSTGAAGSRPISSSRRSTPATDRRLLSKRLGKDIPRFRDALTEYALALRLQHRPTSPQFTITPAMRAEFWQRARHHGLKLNDAQADSVRGVVDQQLTYEIERYVFGPDAEFTRQVRDDRVIKAALELSAGAPSQRELLDRAAARRSAHREDVQPSK